MVAWSGVGEEGLVGAGVIPCFLKYMHPHIISVGLQSKWSRNFAKSANDNI